MPSLLLLYVIWISHFFSAFIWCLVFMLLRKKVFAFIYKSRKHHRSDTGSILLDKVTTYTQKQGLRGVSWKKLFLDFENKMRDNMQPWQNKYL